MKVSMLSFFRTSFIFMVRLGGCSLLFTLLLLTVLGYTVRCGLVNPIFVVALYMNIACQCHLIFKTNFKHASFSMLVLHPVVSYHPASEQIELQFHRLFLLMF